MKKGLSAYFSGAAGLVLAFVVSAGGQVHSPAAAKNTVSADDAPRREPDGPEPLRVRDVLPVRGDDERRPHGVRGQQPREARGEEEVRVDDVGPEAPCGPDGPGRELRVAELAAAAAVEHDPLELVPARCQLALEPLDEDAEVRRGRGGIHLGDEQDAHRRII